jgi:hypothetical protein
MDSDRHYLIVIKLSYTYFFVGDHGACPINVFLVGEHPESYKYPGHPGREYGLSEQ